LASYGQVHFFSGHTAIGAEAINHWGRRKITVELVNTDQHRPTPTNTDQHRPTPTNTDQHRPTPTNTNQHRPTPTNIDQHRPTPTNIDQHRPTSTNTDQKKVQKKAKKGATLIFIATLLALRPIEVFSTSIGGVYISSIAIPARGLVCILCHG
jgi:hypothetical protein